MEEANTDHIEQVMKLEPVHTEIVSPKDQAEADGDFTNFLKHTEQPTHPPKTMASSGGKTPGVIAYFGLQEGVQLAPEAKALLGEIGQHLLPESSDPDEFFMLMQSIERGLPRLDDPLRRMHRMVDELKSLAWKGPIKQQLVDRGAYHIDEAEEFAIQTGNWVRYLKLASRHAKAVRA